ncbi:CYTH domain-containing protein [Marinobacter fonticola]|uniref:CYTH domain-containing protein n=1 Tax=Marinobacter fonticola TaxID=2603215 RepID=UPI0011E74474|nr:CYTH domain-containing protein [Marinobacter fonticola]
MAEELEIKLTLAPGSADKVLAWVADKGSEALSKKRLLNRYYDTPDQALNRHRAALRVRQAGTHYIQTLKTKGEFVEGAHRRNEWEWPLPGADLNLGLLADTPIGDRVNLAELEVVFETNFERQSLLLEDAGSTVEFALDQGKILAGGEALELAEVEFEMKSGDSSALIAWASALAGRVPTFLNLVSKAEQGYWLAGLGEPSPQVEGDDPVTSFLRALSVHWLTGTASESLQAALEKIKMLAIEAGLESQWQWAREQASTSPGHRWMFEPQLIQLQLGLLEA